MAEIDPIAFVSIVVPVYNESASLDALLERLDKACLALQKGYEIVLVDDGSRDGSAEAIVAAAHRDACVTAVVLNRNYGQHAAIMAGFEQTRGDLVITLDADLQNPPEEIGRLVEAAETPADVVGTVRRHRKDSRSRRLASWCINRMAKQATGIDMHDYGCMLRAYRRPIVDAMLACHERSTFIPVLANSFARTTCEIEVAHEERAHGESRYTPLRLINLLFDLVTAMTTAPLRILSLVGGLIAVAGFALAMLLLVLRIAFGPVWSGDGVFTLFAILFGFVGAQFLAMGLLGEYIGRMYHDVRARPRYFIGQIVRARAEAVDRKRHIS